MIVEHYTASGTFASAFNTFAANAPDVELHERPGVCAHFVVDRDGTIYQLVSLRLMCRHTVGLNDIAIGIEHVGFWDAEILGRPAQLRASLRLTRWLQARYGIRTARRHRPRREPLEPLPPRARGAPAHPDARRLRAPHDAPLPGPAVSELVLIRHGETEWSRSMRHTGNTDIPLTEEGEAAARRMAERLAGRAFALVLTSPMQRARETARLAGFGDRAEVDEDLRERDYGDYEGVTTKEVRKTIPGWDVWRDEVPNGETLAQVGARADRVIERALAAGRHAAVRPRPLLAHRRRALDRHGAGGRRPPGGRDRHAVRARLRARAARAAPLEQRAIPPAGPAADRGARRRSHACGGAPTTPPSARPRRA